MSTKRWMVLVGLSGAVFLSLVAATCGSTKTTIQNTESQTHGISVSGQGKIAGKPDLANISLGVSALAPTVAEARTQAATSLGAMIDSMKANGVDEKDIQTSSLSIYPEYNYMNDGRQELRGFRVQNTVNAKIRDIDKTGEIVDEAVDAGGNDTTINGISFSIENPDELKKQAREEAVADARARAETLASAAGVSLGDAINISESSYAPPVFYEGRAAADAAGAPAPETPIEAGELDVTVDVSITFAIN
ncbi:MAG: SIMPL domain-containing protein [Chloroflexi bacterium]|nr:SIMPL domain-containing protein [Chloroflexota bacterium]